MPQVSAQEKDTLGPATPTTFREQVSSPYPYPYPYPCPYP